MTTQTITVNFSQGLPGVPGETIFQNFFSLITLDPSEIVPAGPGITLDVTNTIIQLAAGGTWSGTLEVNAISEVQMNVPPHSGSNAWGAQVGAYDAVSSAFLVQSQSGFLTLDNTNFVDQGGGVDTQTIFDNTFSLSGSSAFNFRLAYMISSLGITISDLAPTTDLVSFDNSLSINLSLTWSDEAPPLPPGGPVPRSRIVVLPLGRKVRLDCERKINLGL